MTSSARGRCRALTPPCRYPVELGKSPLPDACALALDLRAERHRVDPVLGQRGPAVVDPALGHRCVDLRMKLKAHTPAAGKRRGLSLGARQQPGSGRRLELILVPEEPRPGQDEIGGGAVDEPPADLRAGSP